jgi:hypothetical protein
VIDGKLLSLTLSAVKQVLEIKDYRTIAGSETQMIFRCITAKGYGRVRVIMDSCLRRNDNGVK